MRYLSLALLVSLAAAQTTAPEVLTYREVDGRALKAHVFRPASGAKHPAILLFHGGAWQLGNASWMFERAREFAAAGLVAISIDYRLAVEGLSPVESVEDAAAAFAWARANSRKLNIDPHRVAGYGVSAGGHLVAAAATLPSVKGHKLTAGARPNAMLLYSPALNMAQDGYFMRLMRGHGEPRDYSPSAFITRKLPPTLIVQGEKDTIVLTQDAQDFCAQAARARALCELHVYPGVGHLLTRNLAVQFKDFDTDPKLAQSARDAENAFLKKLRYIQ